MLFQKDHKTLFIFIIHFIKQNMEQSSISTNVTIDFKKKSQTKTRRTTQSKSTTTGRGTKTRSSAPRATTTTKKLSHNHELVKFTPKA